MEVSGQNPVLAVLRAGRKSSVPTGYRGRDIPVGIATDYGLDGSGIESQWGRDFPHLSRPALGLT